MKPRNIASEISKQAGLETHPLLREALTQVGPQKRLEVKWGEPTR
jgi:hypothetical protein